MESNIDTSISINKNIFKSGGAIGRLNYFWQRLLVLLIFGFIVKVLELVPHSPQIASNKIILIIGFLVSIANIITLIYTSLLLVYKRCVDILGTKSNALLMTIGMIVLCIIPYVNFFANLYLILQKGKISTLNKIEQIN